MDELSEEDKLTVERARKIQVCELQYDTLEPSFFNIYIYIYYT